MFEELDFIYCPSTDVSAELAHYVQGLGAEVVLAVLLYRRWGLLAGLAAGAGAGVVVGVLDAFVYYPTFSAGYKAVYVALAVLSGVVVAGLGGWALTRALGRAGALLQAQGFALATILAAATVLVVIAVDLAGERRS